MVGVGRLKDDGERLFQEARLLYVGMTVHGMLAGNDFCRKRISAVSVQ